MLIPARMNGRKGEINGNSNSVRDFFISLQNQSRLFVLRFFWEMSGIFLSPSRINFHDTPNQGGGKSNKLWTGKNRNNYSCV